MKAFIKNINWVDEGDVFCFSLIEEDKLEALKEFLEVANKLSDPPVFNLYWGTNESFEFDTEHLLHFINSAVDITSEEIAIFDKFEIYGFDLYAEIMDSIPDELCNIWLTKEDIESIREPFIKIYSKELWDALDLL